MTVITYASLCKAVATTLKDAHIAEQVQAYDELTEAIADTPTLQVYLKEDAAETDDTGIHQSTFQAGVRIARLTVIIDCYARQRSHLAQDMAAQMDIIDAVDAVLCQQVAAPFFGGAKALHWTWKRLVLENAETHYAGAECTLTLWIF